MGFKYTSVSNIGLKRTENEDAIGIFEIENGLLAIVCDGLGGNNAGEIASRLTVDTIFTFFRDRTDIDYLERIRLGIIEANSIVINRGSESFELKGMATTAEVLFLKDNTAYWGHVGDSRIYNFKNKKLKQLTKDHSLVQKLVDEGYLTLKEAENHPNKNIIMRALGDTPEIEVDLSKVKLVHNENIFFLLCTDGITTVIRDFELENIILKRNLQVISTELSKLVEERGAPDNYSFILIEKSDK